MADGIRESRPISLLKDSANLKTVLNYHIVSRHLLAKDVTPGEIMTLHGSTLTAVGSSAGCRLIVAYR
jgi:uncharacterized surface protein with fasciclin (FAS1) repeats